MMNMINARGAWFNRTNHPADSTSDNVIERIINIINEDGSISHKKKVEKSRHIRWINEKGIN